MTLPALILTFSATMVPILSLAAPPKVPANTAKSSPKVADPIADFELIVKKCQTASDKFPVNKLSVTSDGKSWTKKESTERQITYDVRKTESLVSPLVAYIDITNSSVQASTPEESAAHLMILSEERLANWLKQVVRYEFTYRGSWQVVDAKLTTSSKSAGHSSSNTLQFPTGFIDGVPLSCGY